MGDPAGSSGDRSAGRRRPGLGRRGVVWASFGASAVLHLVVILVYPRLMHLEVPPPVPFVVPTDTEGGSAMEVIELIEFAADEDPERPEEPVDPAQVEAPAIAVTGPTLSGNEGPVLIRPGLTAAERLRPDLRDARVWRPVAAERLALSLEQRLDLDLASRILQFQDSVEAAIAAGEAATDWTYTDSEGKRWGVSPGEIHLGDVTIPLPFNFGTAPGKLEEQRELLAVWKEMQRQAARAVIQDSWKERAQAIRRRRDRERTKPDTIGRPR